MSFVNRFATPYRSMYSEAGSSSNEGWYANPVDRKQISHDINLLISSKDLRASDRISLKDALESAFDSIMAETFYTIKMECPKSFWTINTALVEIRGQDTINVNPETESLLQDLYKIRDKNFPNLSQAFSKAASRSDI